MAYISILELVIESILEFVFGNMLIKRGAGNRYSTVEDLFKLGKAFTSNLLLTEKTLGNMRTPYTTDIDMGMDVK